MLAGTTRRPGGNCDRDRKVVWRHPYIHLIGGRLPRLAGIGRR